YRSRMPENNSSQDRGDRKARPTTSAVCSDGTLIELVYDPAKRNTALAVFRNGSWSLEAAFEDGAGDRRGPFSPNNNLIKNEVVLLPSRPEEYGSHDELLVDISQFIHRYLDVSPLFERVASYYVLLTWIYDAFNELPYLRLRGDFGSGKTR